MTVALTMYIVLGNPMQERLNYSKIKHTFGMYYVIIIITATVKVRGHL